MKKITQAQLKELSFLKDWNLTLVNFIKQKYKDEDDYFEYEQVVNETFDKLDLKGMRIVRNDFNEWLKGFLPSPQLNELNQILRNKFGFDLSKYDKANLYKVEGIIKKGIIKNDQEYRLIHDRVEEIYADDEKADEIKILNELLITYNEQYGK